MIYLFFVAMFIAVALIEGDNPLTYPMVWILAGVAAIQWLTQSRRRRQEGSSPSASPISVGADTQSELDMFHGLRDWNEKECPPEVATATCSLSGRDPAYVRALLVMGTLRADEPGRVVAAAARRLLRPAA